ncbi:hypothetical protein DNTS_035086 [Danionella cerebrum]|uniref:Uncharacterized protein n=1 Tax=Danionella cerebrum TaxID=2873325 RepID=A0A553N3Q6_9TELE|nr:hypothetical protein DNTS_035086 [Danionella translucida]
MAEIGITSHRNLLRLRPPAFSGFDRQPSRVPGRHEDSASLGSLCTLFLRGTEEQTKEMMSASTNGPVPWPLSDSEVNNLYRDLELGTVLTLFYAKKSQRPERRTFQVKLETRQVVWTRGTDKIEGESKSSWAFCGFHFAFEF